MDVLLEEARPAARVTRQGQLDSRVAQSLAQPPGDENEADPSAPGCARPGRLVLSELPGAVVERDAVGDFRDQALEGVGPARRRGQKPLGVSDVAGQAAVGVVGVEVGELGKEAALVFVRGAYYYYYYYYYFVFRERDEVERRRKKKEIKVSNQLLDLFSLL